MLISQASVYSIGVASDVQGLTGSLPAYDGRVDATNRQACYQAFTSDKALKRLTRDNQKAGVRVYSTLPYDEIKATLARATGYATIPADRAKTKQRVIASSCSFIGDSTGNRFSKVPSLDQFGQSKHIFVVAQSGTAVASSGPQQAVMLTSCAPNLRAHNGKAENPGDRSTCLDAQGGLNPEAYKAEMKGVWHRFFQAANAEATRLGKPIHLLTPLAGGGAFLEGLSAGDKSRAREIIVEALIEVSNAQDGKGQSLFPNIETINLSIPPAKDGTDPYQQTEAIMRGHQQTAKPIILSNTDMLSLGQTLTLTGKKIAFCNPGSDHVPGGGAYDDRGGPLFHGGHSYKGPSQRGLLPAYSDRASAFEEQLSHFSNFLYIQNLAQNTAVDLNNLRGPAFEFIPLQPVRYKASAPLIPVYSAAPAQLVSYSLSIPQQVINQVGIAIKDKMACTDVYITYPSEQAPYYAVSFATKNDAEVFANVLFDEYQIKNTKGQKKLVHEENKPYYQIYLTKSEYQTVADGVTSSNQVSSPLPSVSQPPGASSSSSSSSPASSISDTAAFSSSLPQGPVVNSNVRASTHDLSEDQLGLPLSLASSSNEQDLQSNSNQVSSPLPSVSQPPGASSSSSSPASAISDTAVSSSSLPQGSVANSNVRASTHDLSEDQPRPPRPPRRTLVKHDSSLASEQAPQPKTMEEVFKAIARMPGDSKPKISEQGTVYVISFLTKGRAELFAQELLKQHDIKEPNATALSVKESRTARGQRCFDVTLPKEVYRTLVTHYQVGLPKPPAAKKTTDAFKAKLQSIKSEEAYTKLFKKADDDLQGTINILKDYRNNWLHRGRHHVAKVKEILASLNDPESDIKTVDDVITEIETYLDQTSHVVNPEGSLARRLAVIKKLKDDQLPEPPGDSDSLPFK